MRKFLVKEIMISSRNEKSAAAIPFHPQTTVITSEGENDTGKSALLKTLVWCFGAESAKVNETWKKLDICAAVRFAVDETDYVIVRHADQFGIFSKDYQLIHTFRGITKEVAPFLTRLFDFGLLLNNRVGKPLQPPPAFYFLPFYIDQDEGWGTTWSSFANLAQFSNWKQPVAEYHIGFFNNEYYAERSKLIEYKANLDEPTRRDRALARAIEQVRQRFSSIPVDFDLERFRAEITELVRLADDLAKDEEKYRVTLAQLSSEKVFLTHKQQIAQRVYRELNRDYKFSVELPENVECPTCGAEYSNSILERFRLALDAETCMQITTEVNIELADLQKKITESEASLAELRQKHGGVWRLLDTKKEAVTLHEVLTGEARGQAISVLTDQLKEIRKEISDIDATIEAAKKSLEKYSSKERKQEIYDVFKAALLKFSVYLEVSIKARAGLRVDFTVKETGSDTPRAILAYFYAFLTCVRAYSNAAFAPIIIDSPNQQDQGVDLYRKMLTFIKDERPVDAQLILAVVDTQGVDFGVKPVVLRNKRQLLSPALYESVGRQLEQLLSRMYELPVEE